MCTFLSLVLWAAALSTQYLEDNPLRLDSLLKAHQNMHFYQSPTLGRSDSVWHKTQHLYLYFDTDSICRQFVRKGGYDLPVLNWQTDMPPTPLHL